MYLALESEFQDYTTTDDIDLVNNVFFFWASLLNNGRNYLLVGCIIQKIVSLLNVTFFS